MQNSSSSGCRDLSGQLTNNNVTETDSSWTDKRSLPIEWRIRFNPASLVYKVLNTGRPPYLTELLQYYKSARSTRSSASDLLSVPRRCAQKWNSLPRHIRQSQT